MEEHSCFTCLFHDTCALRIDMYRVIQRNDGIFFCPQTVEESDTLYINLYIAMGQSCHRHQEGYLSYAR